MFDKRGLVTHPVYLFLFGILLGFVIVYLWSQQYVAVPFPFCAPGAP
jgi:hypothetical protein